MNLSQSILFCAFRYALGRRTYVVSEVVDELVFHWRELEPKYKKIICDEIKDAIDTGNAGMDCDIELWQKVLNLEKK